MITGSTTMSEHELEMRKYMKRKSLYGKKYLEATDTTYSKVPNVKSYTKRCKK